MPTLAELRTDVMREADLVDGQVDTTDLNDLINRELARSYELIVSAFEGWVSSETALTIVAGQDSVALPADFFRPTVVEDLRDPSRPWPMETFEFADRALLARGSGLAEGCSPRRYCVHGSKLYVRPTATAPGTYTLVYVPSYATLVDDLDSFSPPNQGHDLAVLSVAARLRSMQELSTSDLNERAKQARADLEAAARHRKGKHKVRDVRHRSHYRRGLDY